jgi:5-methylcytosine-specific restriction endonuclease McrA
MTDSAIPQAEHGVISRGEAKAQGLRRYFTGAPCKRGHVAERLVCSSTCTVCAAERSLKWYAANEETARARAKAFYLATRDPSAIPRDGKREAARLLGQTRYTNGRPCKHGHTSERFVSSGGCIACLEARSAAFKFNRRDEYLTWRKAHYQANRDKFNERCREYYTVNRERLAARARGWHERNAEHAHARHAKWREANPEKVAAIKRNRRARQSAAEGSHTAADTLHRLELQGGKCACCTKKVGRKYHVDHIVPLSKGGSNWPKNLQILCPTCNARKKDKDPIDFMKSQGLLL